MRDGNCTGGKRLANKKLSISFLSGLYAVMQRFFVAHTKKGRW